MGVVYLAEDQTLDRRVALKVLDRSITAAEDFEHRFRQEARTIAGLNHPNIVQIHSLEKIGDDLVIDMPFIEGGSLADNDRILRMPAPELLNVARDVLLALACCHESGIIHRDVKPSNILLTGNGRALLTDFGLAKVLSAYQSRSISSVSSSGFFLGTPRYAPPEAWDAHEPTPAWDVYSVGLILFEGISGNVVYDAQTPLSLMKQMLERPAPRLDEVAPAVTREMADLIEMMLDRDASKRPKDAGEVLELLAALPELRANAGEPSVLIPKLRPRKEPGRRLSRVSGSRIALAAGAVALVAGLAAFGWVMSARDPGLSAALAPKAPITVPEPGISESFTAYDTVEPAQQNAWSGNLLLLGEPEAEVREFVAYTDTSVWYGKLSSSSSAGVALEGGYAEYTDENARVFRHGNVAGTGSWVRPSAALALSATFLCTQDGSRTARSFILNRAEQQPSFAAFVRNLEGASSVQALLHNELATRQVAWIQSVETRFLGPVSGVVRARRWSEAEAAMSLDGRLDEKPWKDALLTSGMLSNTETITEVVACNSRPVMGKMALGYSAAGLHFGIEMSIPIQDLVFSLSVSEHPAVPIARAPRRFAQFKGSELQASYLDEYGERAAWTCDWLIAHQTNTMSTSIECMVPFSGFEALDRPAAGTRWRFCANVSDAAAPDVGPVAVWGPGDIRAVKHGVLLVFGP